MPFVQNSYSHTVDTYTLLDTPSVTSYPQYAIEDHTGTLKSIAKVTGTICTYNSTNVKATETNVFVQVEGMSLFYQDLKDVFSLLDENILSISCDDTNFSFTVFDTTFYVRTLNLYDTTVTNATQNIQAGLSIPVVYRKGKAVTNGWSCNRNVAMYAILNTNHSQYQSYIPQYKYKMENHFSFSKGAYSSITTQNKLQYVYTIKIRYNTNFLHISYENWNGNEIPLLFVMQGQDINQQKVVFTTLGGAVNSRWYNINDATLDTAEHVINATTSMGIIQTHNNPGSWEDKRAFSVLGHHIRPLYDLFYPGGKDISGTTNVNPFCFFTNLYATARPYTFGVYNLAKSDDTLLTKPICLNGFIDFENVYYAPSGLQKWNANYEINGEQYWCMGSYIRDTIANWSALAYSTAHYALYYDFSLLLKL